MASGLASTPAIELSYARLIVAVCVGNSLRATMYAARIAAASGDAPETDTGLEAKGRYGPSRTAFTASNIAICAMAVRTCVRNAFSGTDAPSDVNRLPQSSSTAGPVSVVTGGCAVTWPLGSLVMSSATGMPMNNVRARRISVIEPPVRGGAKHDQKLAWSHNWLECRHWGVIRQRGPALTGVARRLPARGC